MKWCEMEYKPNEFEFNRVKVKTESKFKLDGEKIDGLAY